MKRLFPFIIAILYPVMLAYGYSQEELFHNNGVFWPAAGILIGALTLLPYRLWLPALLAAYFVENSMSIYLSGEDRPVFQWEYLSNETEAALAAFTLRYLKSRDSSLESLRSYLRIVVAGSLVGGLFGATISILPMLDQSYGTLFSVWRLRWLADTLGILVVCPIVLWWWDSLQGGRVPGRKPSLPEALITSSLYLFLTHYLFSQPEGIIQPFLLYPPVLWIARRFGPLLTSLVLTISVFQAVAHTGAGLGPFVNLGANEDVSLSLQVFAAGLCLSGLSFSCTLSDRDRSLAWKEKALKSLEQSERRYQTLFEQAAVPILVLGENDVERLNPEASQLFEPVLDDLKLAKLWSRKMDERAVVPWTVEIPDADNLELDLYISTLNLNDEQKLQIVIRNKTRQLRLEELLETERTKLREQVSLATSELRKTNEQLAEATMARQRFLGTISHELRTPLTAIVGKCETLREGLWGPLASEQLNSLERITESADFLEALIKDLLDMAKIENPDVTPEISTHDLDDFCRSTIRLISTMARHHQVDLEHSEFPAIEFSVDARFCKQILVTLLTNAIKSSPSGESVGLDVRANDNEIIFEVWDSGPGLPEQFRDSLNNPTLKDVSTVTSYGPSLALVVKLGKALNATLEVQSREAGGSRFVVKVPRSLEPSAPKKKNTVSILLKTAKNNSLDNVCTYLLEQGHRILATSKLDEFRSRLKEKRYDVLLVEADGTPVTFEILGESSDGESGPPIILLAWDCTDIDRKRLTECGATEVIRMPSALPDVEDTLLHRVKSPLQSGQ